MSSAKQDGSFSLHVPPITRTTLALFAGGSGDHNVMHIDSDAAKAAGSPDVFAHGMLSMAYLGRLLTDNFALRDIRKFKVRFTAITNVGDTVECCATPSGARLDRVQTFKLETKANNEKVTLVGEAEIKS